VRHPNPAWPVIYQGIPFRDRGGDRAGCDCWGLITLIYREQLGIALPDYPEIAAGASLDKAREIAAAAEGPEWSEVAAGDERAFDVVLMRGLVVHEGRKSSRPIHVGCVFEPGLLTHIERVCEVSVVNYRAHPRMRHRVEGFYRHRDLLDR
jgi:cell wall-associated NlpC family hydrolase